MMDLTNALSAAQSAMTAQRTATTNRVESSTANRPPDRPAERQAEAAPSARVEISAAAREVAARDRVDAARNAGNTTGTPSATSASATTPTEKPAPAPAAAEARTPDGPSSGSEPSARANQALRMFSENSGNTAKPNSPEVRITA